ncbi:FxsB family cyclophane-forming radical SAM/SPASM peptide maturase [Actinomadura rudentiformis]|uniref:FxsB family radical SAM/SPASM domain protein n=1 Tax=Actinomadura rudentiformis TaxID=359158 RepID=A0A6H9Z0S8_9ACTN|nr:FxsB family cyclophane-forming radical SAM/SPASM peptide maturase [Actinomadura rudentiformis]KAB2351375.1 FxsB family radical SAM/SPASM domain protein [Actinomadura rudentiformis]
MAGRTDGLEWPETLDVDALRAAGWRPVPFQQFILKVHSRCNLGCDYCYMYEMADQGWRSRPRRMSPAIVDRAAARIADHVHTHGLTGIELMLHGGEPLLAGPQLIRQAVTAVRAAVGDSVTVRAIVQTNGVLIDDGFIRLFDELGVSVGVSLDGDAEGHDRHRRHGDGRGSHAEVRAGLERLSAYPHLLAGLLSTIDLRNDPRTTYEALISFGPPAVDFLLPHGNWETPPPFLEVSGLSTPYGDWLIAVFDRWYDAPVRETRVRLFGEIIRMLLGGASQTEAVGLSPSALVVVETDGGIEQVDSLKSAYEGAAGTGLHILRDDFDAALELPSMAARQLGEQALSGQCRACTVRRVCGGGMYAHRYRSGSGFLNPSVYCRDLFRLIAHIHGRVTDDLTEGRR